MDLSRCVRKCAKSLSSPWHEVSFRYEQGRLEGRFSVLTMEKVDYNSDLSSDNDTGAAVESQASASVSKGSHKLFRAVSNKALCAWGFQLMPGGDKMYQCKRCKAIMKQTGSSYGNLVGHFGTKTCFRVTIVASNHPDYNANMQPVWKAYHEDMKRKPSSSLFRPKISKWANTIFGWIELVVLANNAVRICEDMVYRRNTVMEDIARKTLRKYIIKLADIVGLKVREQIGPGNCIIDGWSSAGKHYQGIIHRWPIRDTHSGNIVIKKALLSCQPLLDETSYSSESHAESINACYELFGDADNLVVVITADNTNTNPKTARIMQKPMIGAYCHRLNLATRHWLNDAFDGDLMKNLETINAVMVRASSLKSRGKLRSYTTYVPTIQNRTRWTGYQDMAVKYIKLHDPLLQTGDYVDLGDDHLEDIDVNIKGGKKRVRPNILQGPTLKRFKDSFLPCLQELQKWFIAVQTEMDLSEAMDLFECARTSNRLKDQSHEFEERLQEEHELVKSYAFEQGVRKIITGKSEEMNQAERNACRPLLRSNWPNLYSVEDNEEPSGDINSPTKFMKKLKSTKKRGRPKTCSAFIEDCSWITPTTVEVERLFSKCSKVMTADRRKMHPRIFEAIVCLKENQEWWDVDLVQDMLAGHWDTRLDELYSGYGSIDDYIEKMDSNDIEDDDDNEF